MSIITSDVSVLQHTAREIYQNYGHRVSFTVKAKSLTKFGRNSNLGTTQATLWESGGIESYAAGNTINEIVSDDASDNQQIVIEGHTLSGSDLTFVAQSVTLNGTTPVTLSTPLFRASRAYNNGSTDLAGTVTVYESVGEVTHLQIDGSVNQSLKCASSLSSSDYYAITGIMGSVNRQQTATVDFRLQVREFGKAFRTVLLFSCQSNAGTVSVIPVLGPPVIVRPNSDFRVNATSSASSTSANAIVFGYLGGIVD